MNAMAAGLWLHPEAGTVSGRSIGENCAGLRSRDRRVIRPADDPIRERAGFLNLKGNLFASAIIKTSVISPEFRARYLENPDDPEAFEVRAVVFDGPEDFHARIDDPAEGIGADCILVMRGAGPVGYPGGAEVVNMCAPAHLLREGIAALPCIGDGRQSGTSGSPSILNAAPEAAVGGGLALLRKDDRIRVDLRAGRVDMLVAEDELARRRAALEAAGGYRAPASQTPWQQYFRELTGQFDTGMTLRDAEGYRDVAAQFTPRDNH